MAKKNHKSQAGQTKTPPKTAGEQGSPAGQRTRSRAGAGQTKPPQRIAREKGKSAGERGKLVVKGKRSAAADKLRRKSVPRQPGAWLWLGALGVAFVVLVGVIGLNIRDQGAASRAQNLPDQISVQQAHEKFAQGVFLLDVRTPEEWAEFHVEGTTWIPLDELPGRVAELPRDQEIVVVCRSGNRSQEGRDILRQAGFTQVTSMAGGLLDWREAGYPLVVNSP
jgi:rhodanese-related sulfurtransferase